jgi:nucleoside-diphosphate-sugar epimerase
VKAIVTGASGFVGGALARRLDAAVPLGLGSAHWRAAIDSADFAAATVFHLAARVHRANDPETLLVRDNVEKTVVLAQAAAARGARRLVFLSSIKVHGEETHGVPFHADDPAAPADAYARSKREAEGALRDLAARRGLDVVVVRAPLVVGDGARGNLRALMRIADTAWPLPFAAIDNRRTLVHVDDLAALLVAAGTLPQARGRIFLAGHPDAVSTPRLVRVIREALGRPARLLPLPARVLEGFGVACGRGASVRRLTRSLEVDASACRELDWSAAIPMDEGIAAMARAFRAGERSS